VSSDGGQEIHVEGGVHGAECLPGEVEGARLAEHVVGEDVDAPPTDRRSATEHVEGRLVGQLPDPDPGELRSDPGDPLLNRGIHLGEVLAQGLVKHLRPRGSATITSAVRIAHIWVISG
jgi:hypothetical protein